MKLETGWKSQCRFYRKWGHDRRGRPILALKGSSAASVWFIVLAHLFALLGIGMFKWTNEHIALRFLLIPVILIVLGCVLGATYRRYFLFTQNSVSLVHKSLLGTTVESEDPTDKVSLRFFGEAFQIPQAPQGELIALLALDANGKYMTLAHDYKKPRLMELAQKLARHIGISVTEEDPNEALEHDSVIRAEDGAASGAAQGWRWAP